MCVPLSLNFAGVYLTSLSPDYDKITVAKTCWGPASKSAIEKRKLDYAIRIEIPRKDPTPPKETVYRYIGQLDLQDYTHEFLKCNWRNDNNDGIVIGLVTGLVGAIAVLGVAVVKAIL